MIFLVSSGRSAHRRARQPSLLSLPRLRGRSIVLLYALLLGSSRTTRRRGPKEPPCHRACVWSCNPTSGASSTTRGRKRVIGMFLALRNAPRLLPKRGSLHRSACNRTWISGTAWARNLAPASIPCSPLECDWAVGAAPRLVTDTTKGVRHGCASLCLSHGDARTRGLVHAAARGFGFWHAC